MTATNHRLRLRRERARFRDVTQAMLAEGVGTFALVFAGTGAVIIDATTGGGVTHVGIGLTFSLIIFVMISAVGHISGAHFNPAVTLAFACARHFPWSRVGPYLLAQCGGAIAASLLLRGMFGTVAHLGATLPRGSNGQSLLLEAALTFFLMFVITAVATDTRAVTQTAALAIGGTVGLEALFAGPISGASMNPARSPPPSSVARARHSGSTSSGRYSARSWAHGHTGSSEAASCKETIHDRTDPCPLPLHAQQRPLADRRGVAAASRRGRLRRVQRGQRSDSHLSARPRRAGRRGH